MQIDPAVEWRRLTEQYRSMSDEELRELAQDLVDLTETAQQALRQEMRSRGLGEPESARSARQRPASTDPQRAPLALKNAPWAGDPVDIAFGAVPARTPELVPDSPDVHDEGGIQSEYTWKTELCELATPEEAMQLQEVLNRAGLESWIRLDGIVYPFVPSTRDAIRIGLGGFQFLVAADQLERAREIAARPIPREIIDESKVEVPEFVEPKCPKCGSDDVVLEGVDRENRWRCEECDAEWSDGTETGDTEAEKADDLPS